MHSVGKINTFIRRGKRPSKAQAMTEFALIIPILLVLLYGIIEGGRLLFIYTSVAAAGREAARYAAGIGNVASLGQPLYNDCAGIRAAATRIGFFAGVKASDVHIYHDSGPGTTATEYCKTPTDTLSSVAEGDRIDVKIFTPYNPIVPILPIGPMTLRSDNAHTILTNVAVNAATPQSLPNLFTCPVDDYKIDETDPVTSPIKITISNADTKDIYFDSILIIWDTTAGPLLTKIEYPTGTTFKNLGSGVAGPLYPQLPLVLNPKWKLTAGGSIDFSLYFSKTLKNPVIFRMTFETTDTTTGEPIECSLGR
jgi:hypothetical protein